MAHAVGPWGSPSLELFPCPGIFKLRIHLLLRPFAMEEAAPAKEEQRPDLTLTKE